MLHFVTGRSAAPVKSKISSPWAKETGASPGKSSDWWFVLPFIFWWTIELKADWCLIVLLLKTFKINCQISTSQKRIGKKGLKTTKHTKQFAWHSKTYGWIEALQRNSCRIERIRSWRMRSGIVCSWSLNPSLGQGWLGMAREPGAKHLPRRPGCLDAETPVSKVQALQGHSTYLPLGHNKIIPKPRDLRFDVGRIPDCPVLSKPNCGLPVGRSSLLLRNHWCLCSESWQPPELSDPRPTTWQPGWGVALLVSTVVWAWQFLSPTVLVAAGWADMRCSVLISAWSSPLFDDWYFYVFLVSPDSCPINQLYVRPYLLLVTPELRLHKPQWCRTRKLGVFINNKNISTN